MEGFLLELISIFVYHQFCFIHLPETAVAQPRGPNTLYLSGTWHDSHSEFTNIDPYTLTINQKVPLDRYYAPSEFISGRPENNIGQLHCGDRFTSHISENEPVKTYWFDYTTDIEKVFFTTCMHKYGSNSTTPAPEYDTVLYIINNTRFLDSSFESWERFVDPNHETDRYYEQPYQLVDYNDNWWEYPSDTCSFVGLGSIQSISYKKYGYYILLVNDKFQYGNFSLDVGCQYRTDSIVKGKSNYNVPLSDMVTTESGGLQGEITCGDIIENNTTNDFAMHYYKFVKKTEFIEDYPLVSFVISTCDSYDTHVKTGIYGDSELHLYFLGKTEDDENYLIDECDNTQFLCESTKNSYDSISLLNKINSDCVTRYPVMYFTADSLSNGDYYIAITGFHIRPVAYRIEFLCQTKFVGLHPLDIATMIAVVFFGLLLLFLIFLYSYRKSIKYYKKAVEDQIDFQLNPLNVIITPKQDEKEEKPEEKPEQTETDVQVQNENESENEKKNENENENENESENVKKNESENENKNENKTENENAEILELMAEIIEEVNNGQGLDIYQMFSVRTVDRASLSATPSSPFKFMGYDKEFLNISKYHTALFMVIIVLILQTFGMTLILWYNAAGYFENTEEVNSDGDPLYVCEYTFPHWADDFWMKVLSFFWCLVITFTIQAMMTSVKGNGITRILDHENENLHLGILIFDPFLAQIGVFINFYVLLLAVFGSFFVIYQCEGGQDALDMVLNSVALFFMIELDDILVTVTDYEDVIRILKRYVYCIENGISYENHQRKRGARELRCCKDKVTDKVLSCSHWIFGVVPLIVIVFCIITPFLVMVCF